MGAGRPVTLARSARSKEAMGSSLVRSGFKFVLVIAELYDERLVNIECHIRFHEWPEFSNDSNGDGNCSGDGVVAGTGLN